MYAFQNLLKYYTMLLSLLYQYNKVQNSKKIWNSATLKLKLLVCLLDTWQLYCCVSVADRPLWPPNSPMPTKCLPITNKDLTWMMSGRRFWGGVLCIPGNRTSSSRTLALFLCFIPSTETVADRGLLVHCTSVLSLE